MQALYILPKGCSLADWVENVPCLTIYTLSPTLLSAFTALRIAKELDSRCIDLIVAYNVRDAMAAISARKLSRNKPKIAVELTEAKIPPHGIPSELAANIDSWLCASARLQQLIAARLEQEATLSPSTIWESTPTLLSDDWKYKDPGRKSIYLWVGSIDNNTHRLRQAIEMANSCPLDVTLRIWGTGKAQLVMPLVRLARSIENPSRIEWVGDADSLERALDGAYALVQSGQEPGQLELELARRGMPLLLPAQLGDNTAYVKECASAKALGEELLAAYLAIGESEKNGRNEKNEIIR